MLQIADDLRAMLAAANAVAGLTELEGRALRYLAAATPQRDLASLLRCDAPRVSQVVTRLVTRGFVRRKVGGDRRTRVVVPTPAGLEVLERAAAVLRAQSPILHRLDRDQRRQLYDLLRLMRPDDRVEPK